MRERAAGHRSLTIAFGVTMHDSDHPKSGAMIRQEWIHRYAVEQFQAARGGDTAIRAALCRYFKQGTGAGFSTGELVDWLGVSSPSILDRAGYSDDEAARAMDIVASVSDAEIEQTRLGPERHLP